MEAMARNCPTYKMNRFRFHFFTMTTHSFLYAIFISLSGRLCNILHWWKPENKNSMFYAYEQPVLQCKMGRMDFEFPRIMHPALYEPDKQNRPRYVSVPPSLHKLPLPFPRRSLSYAHSRILGLDMFSLTILSTALLRQFHPLSD